MQIYFCINKLTGEAPHHIILFEVRHTMKKNIYLTLSIIGFMAAAYFVIKFYVNGDITLSDALAQLSSNSMGQLLLADFTISIFASWYLIYNESKKLGMKYWWFYILLTCGVGFCFAWPLFLYFRERKLESG